MFVFDESIPQAIPAEITLKGGSFKLMLSPPSVTDRATEDALTMQTYNTTGATHTAAFSERLRKRLERVVGWEGITDKEGKPVEFNSTNLFRLISKIPAVLDQLGDHFVKLFSTEDTTTGEPVASPSDSPS